MNVGRTAAHISSAAPVTDHNIHVCCDRCAPQLLELVLAVHKDTSPTELDGLCLWLRRKAARELIICAALARPTIPQPGTECTVPHRQRAKKTHGHGLGADVIREF